MSSIADALSRDSLADELSTLGIRSGDHLGLGVSFRSLGPVEGGPKTLIDALLDVVGADGTVMVPAFTRMASLRDIRAGKADQAVFEHASTPAYTGAVSEVVRARPEAVRSLHPTNSVAAIGRLAQQLTEGHDETRRAYLPYSRLAEAGGRVLCIGIGDRLVGIRHEAQALAGLLDVVPLQRGIMIRDGNGPDRLFERGDVGGCIKVLPDLVPELRRRGWVKDGGLGRATVTLSDAQGVLVTMTEMLREHPERNLCRMTGCVWCRELERRLRLYGRIPQPRWFQRNRLAGEMIGLVNRFRL